jgi:hypothetical protein
VDFLEEREIAATLGIIGAGERIRTLDPRITSGQNLRSKVFQKGLFSCISVGYITPKSHKHLCKSNNIPPFPRLITQELHRKSRSSRPHPTGDPPFPFGTPTINRYTNPDEGRAKFFETSSFLSVEKTTNTLVSGTTVSYHKNTLHLAQSNLIGGSHLAYCLTRPIRRIFPRT